MLKRPVSWLTSCRSAASRSPSLARLGPGPPPARRLQRFVRLPWVGGGLIARARRDVWHSCQNTIEGTGIGSTRSLLEVAHRQKRRRLFRHGRRDKLIDRHIVLFGEFPDFLVQRIWKSQAQTAHWSSRRICRNAAGVSTRMLNDCAPPKSRTLWVTTEAAWAATASSRTNSSPGSLRVGRHRK